MHVACRSCIFFVGDECEQVAVHTVNQWKAKKLSQAGYQAHSYLLNDFVERALQVHQCGSPRCKDKVAQVRRLTKKDIPMTFDNFLALLAPRSLCH